MLAANVDPKATRGGDIGSPVTVVTARSAVGGATVMVRADSGSGPAYAWPVIARAQAVRTAATAVAVLPAPGARRDRAPIRTPVEIAGARTVGRDDAGVNGLPAVGRLGIEPRTRGLKVRCSAG